MKKDIVIIGIDASNLLYGGGRTHIVEILSALDFLKFNSYKVIIWGSFETLSLFSEYSWLEKRVVSKLSKGIFTRSIWQTFSLSKLAMEENCDVLFVPSGIFLGRFRPFVTMSRNLLPFDNSELFNYGFSLITLRLLFLRFVLIFTLKRANGIIFLTNYSMKTVFRYLNKVDGIVKVIPHGVSERFRAISPYNLHQDFSFERPFFVTYVSHIEMYKNHWNVIESIYILRSIGIPIQLNLVGSYSSKKAVKIFNKAIMKFDPNLDWINYYGPVPFNQLHEIYSNSHIGIFASSCENMPNTLIEMMASSLPIACSNFGPMPEILKNNGLYFNPKKSIEISKQVFTYYNDYRLRIDNGVNSCTEANNYSWYICAKETFEFLKEIQNLKENKEIDVAD